MAPANAPGSDIQRRFSHPLPLGRPGARAKSSRCPRTWLCPYLQTLSERVTASRNFGSLVRDVRDVERDGDASRLPSCPTVGRRPFVPHACDRGKFFPRDLTPRSVSFASSVPVATCTRRPSTCPGALAPERIVITPDARLVLVEHVFSAALEELQWSSERYWKDLRIALPPDGEYHFTRRGDVFQAGTIALGLLLGRPLGEEEYPASLSELANGTFGLGGGFEPFPQWLRSWLSRALWLDPSRAFASAGCPSGFRIRARERGSTASRPRSKRSSRSTARRRRAGRGSA